ncbi:hypothetical protein [Roseateles albus]|uniref:VCBS repeat-containing protein n=1 Tax=Roseateles albus TaxID=2987525 RepID=A0ABT5KAY3_9BURK|nr:hypothetical protein [Roseateles albus]MDC8770537.1 hypothetical protein [Roseateles albus]
MKRVIILLVALALNTASAQGTLEPAQFPFWAEQVWTKLAAEKSLQISTRLNPFVWRGDFNGDGRQDLAMLILNTKTKKEGIAFLLQGKKPVTVGAGQDFGNGGDNFSWIDVWHVEDRGTGHGNYLGQSVTLKVDGLMVAKDSSASALIYFRNGKPVWHQYGD